jgi:hypothetical protein
MTAAGRRSSQANLQQRMRARVFAWAAALMLTTHLPGPAWGQTWTGGPTGPIYYNSGNVGIGTTTPAWSLHVAGTGAVWGGVESTAATGYAMLVTKTDARQWEIATAGSGTGLPGKWYVYDRTTGGGQAGVRLLIDPTGNVGIGTTNPTAKLSVNGTIRTKEVVVDTGWADYVFKPDYQLPALSEVGAYIREHHHLPGVPSEKDVQEKGVGLGEMQAKLLAKVEELTLHMIQADETSRRLQQQNERLEQQNKEFQERLTRVGL